MMNNIRMEDVPTRIWDQTYEKWSETLIDGWNDKLWFGCALCEWCNGRDDGCVRCPLRRDGWCNNTADISRLHIDYYRYKEITWEDAIEDFLVYIKPYCTHETD